MPKLPSSKDVQKVSAQAGRDPGVRLSGTPNVQSVTVPSINVRETRVPDGSFASSTGMAAEELAPALDNLAVVARAQENRRDTVDRADKINKFRTEANNELLRLNTEDDLSNDQVLHQYGQFLQKRRQELFSSHGGSEDSRASLGIRLQELESEAIGSAAAVSTRLGRDKVVNLYNDRLAPLVQSVTADPSLKNIDKAYLALETDINDIKGAFDPSEEDSMLRRGGREQIAMSAVNSLITRGRIGEADALMNSGLQASLSPEIYRNLNDRIQSVKYAKDEFARKMTEVDTILGRPHTQEEALSMLGLDAPAEKIVAVADETSPTGYKYVTEKQAVGMPAPDDSKMTERDKEVYGLVNRGIDPDTANDIADGNVRVVGPDNFGNLYRVNVVTNEKSLIPTKQAGVFLGMVQDTVQEMAEKPQKPSGTGSQQRPIEDAVEQGTGPFASIQSFISDVFGPLTEGADFEDTTQARQQISTFTQMAKTALVNNDRFPMGEQQLVANLLPDPDKFFKDPDTAVSNLKQLRTSLTGLKDAKSTEMSKQGITTERKGELSDQISRIDEILTIMSPGESSEKQTVNTQAEIDALPPGTKAIWGPTGKGFTKN